jgi:competence protein ComEC
VAGILSYIFIPSVQILSLTLLAAPLFIVIAGLMQKGRQRMMLSYEGRWMWGVVFYCLLLFVSIQTTYLHDVAGENALLPYDLVEWAAKVQHKLIEPLAQLNLPESSKAVLSTITVGERSELPREVRTGFAMTGVAHILAVSGFHVGVVCGFLTLWFSLFPSSPIWRRIRYCSTLLLLWLFVIISGMAPSSIRAAIMLTLYLTGRLLRRQADSYNILAAAAFLMLAIKPAYLFDVGFQLSFASLASIIYMNPRLQSLLPVIRNPLIRIPWQWVTLSVSAQAGVSFLALYYFGRFSTVFLLANLPLTLMATILIPITLVWFMLPVSVPGYALLQSAIEQLTAGMMWIVDTLGRLPGASFSFRFNIPVLIGSYLALFLLCRLIFRNKPSAP